MSRMGAMTDPTTDVGDYQEKADGDAESVDVVRSQGLESPTLNNVHPNGSNGIHLQDKIRAGTTTDPTTDATSHQEESDVVPESIDSGQSHAKRADERPNLPPSTHVRRGSSGGILRFASGGIHRGASGGIHRGASGGIHRGPSGGIFRGISGNIHLPSFEMTLLPEDDAGVQMHFTEAKEVGASPGTPGESDSDAPPRKKSRLRKHLTAVGACSFGFRLSETLLSLIAIVVMCSNSQSVGNLGTLKFNHFQAYSYLVAVNVCVFVYSSIQFIQLAYTVILGISFIPSIIISTWVTFGFDQLFTYLLLSASTSAATIANISYTGEMGVQLCSRFDLNTFCARADAAVTISFFTFLAMLSSTSLAIYRIGVLMKEWG